MQRAWQKDIVATEPIDDLSPGPEESLADFVGLPAIFFAHPPRNVALVLRITSTLFSVDPPSATRISSPG